MLLAGTLLGPKERGGYKIGKGLRVKWSEVDAGYMGHLLRNCSLLIFLTAKAAEIPRRGL